ncbi:MAG: DMT family transporter [Candidatus Krumholzibacteria bacterium]|nr:DMT family transporter [Candidatus Krumholzibacteria bacterium]
MTGQNKAYILALIAVLLWSTVASAFKLSLEHVDHIQLVFYASLVSTLILGAILGGQGKLRLVFTCSRRQYLRSAMLGFLNPFLYYLVLFKAYDLLPAQEAQPLNYTWALTLSLLAVPLLKQKISLRDIAALCTGYCGVVVISTHGDVLGFRLSDPIGVVLALGSAFVWALYWIYNTKDTRDPAVALFLSFIFSLPLSLLVCVTFSSIRPTHVHGLLGTIYVGAFEMSVTFLLWLSALRLSANAAKVSTLIFLSPFVSLIFIHHIVGEEILRSTLVGLVLIVAGLLLQRVGASRTSR